MDLRSESNEYLATIKNKNTTKCYKIDIFSFLEFLGDRKINKVLFGKYKEILSLKYKAKTIKRKLNAIRSFFNYLNEKYYSNIDVDFSFDEKTAALNKLRVQTEDLEKFNVYFNSGVDDLTKEEIHEIITMKLLFHGYKMSNMVGLEMKDCTEDINVYSCKANNQMYVLENNNGTAMQEQYIRKHIKNISKKILGYSITANEIRKALIIRDIISLPILTVIKKYKLNKSYIHFYLLFIPEYFKSGN